MYKEFTSDTRYELDIISQRLVDYNPDSKARGSLNTLLLEQDILNRVYNWNNT